MGGGSRSNKFLGFPEGSQFRQYNIVKKLGSGSFGDVYQVANTATGEEFAMKVEGADEEESMIKMEVAVLKTFRNSPWPHPHVCDYIDSGATPTCRYVVMKLCGPNLADVQKSCPRSRFTESTTVRLGLQGVRSIEAVHRIGFLHRDVKPANYAIGLGAAQRTIFLLDYGLSRQYVNRHGQLRPPRAQAGFRGTVRYASLNAHLRRDLGRHDDLWCLLYMLVEVQKGTLPWRRIYDKARVAKLKRTTMADALFEGMAQEFHAFQNELQGLEFADTPNYEYFCQLLRSVMKRKKYRDDDPYDWEEGGVGHGSFRRAHIEQPYKTQKEEQKQVKLERGDEEKSQFSERPGASP